MDSLYYVLLGSALILVLMWFKERFWSFTAQAPMDYANAPGDMLDIRTYLNGPIECEGVIYGPTGRVTSRFVGQFEAEWDGNTGVMKERFDYDNGSVQHREWRLTLDNDGQIKALADDVVGEGSGEISGPTVLLKYKIRLPEASGGHVLSTTDWMYLAPNGTIVNRSQFRKFGIKVAELVATMRKKDLPT